MKIGSVAGLLLLFALGIVVGYILRNYNVSLPLIIQSSCTYAGKTYKLGESFRATDGCNSCTCSNGQVACTLVACNK